MPVSARVASRISSELKKYQAVLSSAKQRDVSESNTVLIVTDMLADVFGYDKYHHITTEHSVRGTYVDLAVIVDDDIRFLIEAKAIGIDLKDNHVKQAIDYGANKGTEWIVLTNGAIWRVYKVHFGQPIDKSLIFEIDILSIKSQTRRRHRMLWKPLSRGVLKRFDVGSAATEADYKPIRRCGSVAIRFNAG